MLYGYVELPQWPGWQDATAIHYQPTAARLRARRWQKSVIPIENDHCIRWILESRIFNAFQGFFDSQGIQKLQRLPVSFFEGLKVFCSSMFKVLKTASFLWACLLLHSHFIQCFVMCCPYKNSMSITKKNTNKRWNALQKVFFFPTYGVGT